MGGAGPGADSGVAGPQLLQHRTLAVGESGCLAREGLPSGYDLGMWVSRNACQSWLLTWVVHSNRKV